MAKYTQIKKPKSIKNVKYDLYYMSSNSLDANGTSYRKITNDEVLEIASRVYKRTQRNNLPQSTQFIWTMILTDYD